MLRPLSPMLGESCGRREAALSHPHPSTSRVAEVRRANFSRLSALKTCRCWAYDGPLTRCCSSRLYCYQHPVRHRYGCARLTGDARPTKKSTDIEGRGDETPVFVISGLRLSCLEPERTHRQNGHPGLDSRHRAFGPSAGRVLCAPTRSRNRGPAGGPSFHGLKTITGRI